MTGFIDSPIGMMLNRFYTKQGNLPSNWQPFLMNRFLSMNPKMCKQSFDIDRFVFKFYDDKEFMELLIDCSIPKHSRMPFNKYIKKPAEKALVYKPIIDMLQKKYHWTDREVGIQTPLLLLQFSNKDKLREILDYMGADMSLYKKLKVKVEKVKIPVKKTKSLFDF